MLMGSASPGNLKNFKVVLARKPDQLVEQTLGLLARRVANAGRAAAAAGRLAAAARRGRQHGGDGPVV